LVYLPPAFTEAREDALIAHIERYDFAVLVTRGAEVPIVSQIPFLLERRDGRLFLQGHLAGPNPAGRGLRRRGRGARHVCRPARLYLA
jgi:transcriptional regulator